LSGTPMCGSKLHENGEHEEDGDHTTHDAPPNDVRADAGGTHS
jgi:hypothetical protein